jgi:hypothetical protein
LIIDVNPNQQLLLVLVRKKNRAASDASNLVVTLATMNPTIPNVAPPSYNDDNGLPQLEAHDDPRFVCLQKCLQHLLFILLLKARLF